MSFHLDPKPVKPKRTAAYYVGYVAALVIAVSALGVVVATAISAIRWILGA